MVMSFGILSLVIVGMIELIGSGEESRKGRGIKVESCLLLVVVWKIV